MDRLERVKRVVKWLISEGIVKSQNDLANLMGYNDSSVSQIMTGRVKLSNKFVSRLAQVNSKINIKYFEEEEEPMLVDNTNNNVKTNESITIQKSYFEELINRIIELEKENTMLRNQLKQYTNIEKEQAVV